MNRLYPEFVRGPGAVGLLVLRVVTGLAFMFHGWPKIRNPMGWMGDAPVPGILQAAAAVSEFAGGFALILGVLTPLACLGIGGTMAFAVFMYHLREGHPFVPAKPGEPSYELAAVYLAIVLMFLVVGPGKLSLDGLMFDRKGPSAA